MVFLSWQTPVFVSIFIIAFDVYWLLKSIYLSLHLRHTYKVMRAIMAENWLKRLEIEYALPSVCNHSGHSDEFVYSDCATPSWREMHHLIIFPMYKEPLSLVRDSFLSLCKANYPLDRFMVVLAIEESAGEEARATAREIEREFADKFYKFMVTIHPAGLPGEIPGKGSNESWSAREAKRLIIDPLTKELGLSLKNNSGHSDESVDSGRFLSYDKILVSVFDVDTQIFPDYFGRLTYVFLNAPDRLRAIYQPIPLFTNNIYESPALARVIAFTTSFWQMMQQSRPARLTTFSSQSVPLPVLLNIGFWHKDIVSEDSRIFWQCYLHYHGDFRVEPMFYPVAMDANCAPTFWGTMKNIYKQQRRWAWGVENTPYLLEGFRKDPLIPARKKWYWSFVDLEGRHSWATNALMIFALGWLPVALGGKIFNATLLSYNLTDITRTIINISMAGVGGSAIFGILLLPEKPTWFKLRHYLLYILQWALIPITLIFFGAFPGLDAQTRLMLGGKFRLGFWVTPKGRYSKT